MVSVFIASEGIVYKITQPTHGRGFLYLCGLYLWADKMDDLEKYVPAKVPFVKYFATCGKNLSQSLDCSTIDSLQRGAFWVRT